MSFIHPWALLPALLVVLGLVWLYNRLRRRVAVDALTYSSVAFMREAMQPRAWIPALLRICLVGGIALLALAAAGPRLLLPLPVHDGDVFICIDTSGSMQSTDVAPTRFDAAKAAARAFIRETPTGTKIGIIAFSSAASVIAPLSARHSDVASALSQLPYPNGGTAIGDALRTAAQNLPAGGHRAVVLITDGVNNLGTDPQAMAQYLGAHHIPIYTVGIGTNAGDVIPGTTQQATIDEPALQGYASVSGGAYARAQNATQLRRALARLGRITSIERKPVNVSLAAAFMGAAALLVALFANLGAGRLA